MKFKVFDTTSNVFVDAPDFHHLYVVNNPGGVAELKASVGYELVPFTGVTTEHGDEVYDGDIVEAIVGSEGTDRDDVTECIFFEGGSWHLGGFEGDLDDHVLKKIVGNRRTTRWPLA